MTRKITPSLFVAALLALHLGAAPAHAQASGTYVSAAIGNDANACSNIAAPCRTFQRAHDQTNPQGQITVLDPGGYGAVTITKAISIMNDGVGEASILVSGGGIGITIDATEGDSVNLRGITMQGIGFGGGTGLRFNSGFALTVTNCVARNNTADGIQFFPTGASVLAVANTLLADNGAEGILVAPTGAGVVRVALNWVQAYNNANPGIAVSGTGSSGVIGVTVADSVSANNATGIFALNSSALAATVMVARSTISNSRLGAALISSGPNASLVVGQSAISGNAATWLAINGGVLESFGNNYIFGNFDGDPAPPTIPTK